MLDFRVKTFLTVCELGNYTKAAEKLGLTQPAVTQHIKFIEDRYRVKLLTKDGKTMKLTRPGEVLRDMFITLQADEEEIKRRITGIEGEPKPVVMGGSKSICENVMPRIAKKYIEANPSAQFVMYVDNKTNLLRKLKDGELEFLIADGRFDKNTFWHKTFSKEKMVCLCQPGSDMAGKTVPIERILKERIIVRETGSGTREIFENALENNGYSTEDFAGCTVIGNINGIKNLVADGCGVTFMFEAAAEKELKEGRLSVVDVEGFDIKHEFHFICLKDSMFLGEFQSFFDFAVNNKSDN